MKKETLASIAERTGFSITTVSRVLCGNAAKYRICKATEEIIVQEARRCAYTPVALAQKLRTKSTKTIGLLCRLFRIHTLQIWRAVSLRSWTETAI